MSFFSWTNVQTAKNSLALDKRFKWVKDLFFEFHNTYIDERAKHNVRSRLLKTWHEVILE
jgi:hypothetical protein